MISRNETSIYNSPKAKPIAPTHANIAKNEDDLEEVVDSAVYKLTVLFCISEEL